MMPQAIAAMSLKLTMPRILARFGYRGVLVSNTLIIGLLILLFATIGKGTPVWLIVAQVFCLRILHVAAIHEHEHAGLCRRHRGTGKQRQLHREHDAADGHQLSAWPRRRW